MSARRDLAAAVEELVDATSLHAVLRALGETAFAKADHLESNWQDGAAVVLQKLRRSRVFWTGRPFGASSSNTTGSWRGPSRGDSARPKSSCSLTAALTPPSS